MWCLPIEFGALALIDHVLSLELAGNCPFSSDKADGISQRYADAVFVSLGKFLQTVT
jgi:hypothetical protein